MYGSGLAQRSPHSNRSVVGFVNNMPDAAFYETYTQFASLIAGKDSEAATMTCFYMPSIPCDPAVLLRFGCAL